MLKKYDYDNFICSMKHVFLEVVWSSEGGTTCCHKNKLFFRVTIYSFSYYNKLKKNFIQVFFSRIENAKTIFFF